ncbi:hypothetical protein ARMSODRAFT_948113 [Armillaria solidipes]|uniref:LysM domain-containing protein n=2 Tax=Armillaria TaxID=47424 RepID=A0A2H3C4U0_9AGAR|nr:hypothetical protein EV421DRAFT_1865163 [Armillaria borealis]PBK76324.1 hypothetical protein ARMSODRAFT_948113 [Armillaria solidipes]
MGRWTQYDEDSYRLPEGMERIGYDSDTQTYFYRDANGDTWKGAEGAEYSEMTRVSGASSSTEDIEAAPRRADGYQQLATDLNRPMVSTTYTPNPSAYRTLFPFFLIIAVVLLLVWRLILSPGLSVPKSPCAQGMQAYWVQAGDSCWEIATRHGYTLEELQGWNPKVECEVLMPGTTVCLPGESK